MIKSWRLAHFKSVLDEINLPFAPLTLFTGANSSGKSTIIQSLLLTTQTVQSSVDARPVVLNGHIARLGSYRDLVYGADESRDIVVGFELADLGADQQNVSQESGPWYRKFSPVVSDERINGVQCEFSFSVRDTTTARDLLQLQPILERSRLLVSHEDENGVKKKQDEILLKRSDKSVESRLNEYNIDASNALPTDTAALRFEIEKLPPEPNRFSWRRVEGEAIGATFAHFLPRAIVRRVDKVEAEVSYLLAAIAGRERYYGRMGRISREQALTVPEAAAERIAEIILANTESTSGLQADRISQRINEFRNSRNINSITNIFTMLGPKAGAQLAAAFEQEKVALEKLLRDGRRPVYQLEADLPSDSIATAVEIARGFFARWVKYLGPLRDEPKPIYPLAGATDPADVGFRGEHTAAVLDLLKNNAIRYIPSAQFVSEGTQYLSAVGSLEEAVLDWLKYMGVGTDLITSDQGKLGHELKISTESDMQHDLTQVGVGVSQVLPILVLALISEPGSTLIFEQPELHLHPRVQSRLGDFFVSMTRLGKQCIVETHSEYLVNRLRYRAVADAGDDVAKSVIAYHVEKHGAKSSYRRVEIDDLGMIRDWPAGFFDESELGTAELLRKGLEKRARKAEKQKDSE